MKGPESLNIFSRQHGDNLLTIHLEKQMHFKVAKKCRWCTMLKNSARANGHNSQKNQMSLDNLLFLTTFLLIYRNSLHEVICFHPCQILHSFNGKKFREVLVFSVSLVSPAAASGVQNSICLSDAWGSTVNSPY